MQSKKGFTLIELLVVIAIIGILSTIVLVSLSGARNKGDDAAIKSDLNTVQTQAELYNSGSGYNGMCGDTTIARAIADIASKGSPVAATCNPQNNNYAAYAQLTSVTGQWFCVDSSGKAEVATSTYPASPITACP